MANWSTLKIDQLFPPQIRQAASAVGEVVSTLSEYLDLVRQALTLAATVTSGATTNPVESALNVALNQIQALVDGAVAGSTVHAIAIPIQKQYYGRGVRATLADRLPELTPTFDQLVDNGAFPNRNSSTLPNELVGFVNTSVTAVGGNQGFWRVLMVSLQDLGDVQRPLFPTNFAVAGACIVFGATDLTSIQPNFSLLNSLINAGERSDLAAHTRPVLRNLQGRVVTTVRTTGRLVVALTWDAVSPVVSFPLFSDEQFIVREVFILRSEDPTLRDKFAWSDVFSRQPQASTSDLQDEGGVAVVARLVNDGFIHGYTDSASTLTSGTVYYYTAAIRYTISDVAQPMSNFSNCIRVQILQPQQSRLSVPPDWIALPTLATLFPALTEVTALIDTAFSNLRSRTVSNSGVATMLNQTVQQITQVVTQLQGIAANLQSVNTRLGALSTTGMAAVSSTVLSVNSGGIDNWMSELAARLADTSDTSRPAFDNAELVAGVVVVAGAPSLAQLTATLALLESFFGSHASSSLVAAVASIEAEAAPATGITFNASMVGTRAPVGETAPAAEPIGFDASMRPTTTPEC